MFSSRPPHPDRKNKNMPEPVKLTQMERLVIEVIASRFREGWQNWTFRHNAKSLLSLKDKGLITFVERGPSERLASLTQAGKDFALSPDYDPPSRHELIPGSLDAMRRIIERAEGAEEDRSRLALVIEDRERISRGLDDRVAELRALRAVAGQVADALAAADAAADVALLLPEVVAQLRAVARSPRFVPSPSSGPGVTEESAFRVVREWAVQSRTYVDGPWDRVDDGTDWSSRSSRPYTEEEARAAVQPHRVERGVQRVVCRLSAATDWEAAGEPGAGKREGNA